MPTSMGVTNPKLANGVRKLKKAKHCTIPKTLKRNENQRAFGMRNRIQSRKW